MIAAALAALALSSVTPTPTIDESPPMEAVAELQGSLDMPEPGSVPTAQSEPTLDDGRAMPGEIPIGTPIDGIPLPADVAEAISTHFPREHQRAAVQVARCESGFDPQARNPRSSAGGLWQFIDRTWQWVSGVTGGLSRFDVNDAAQAAAWLVDYTITVERRAPWSHWECRSAIR